ncbi:hypothetical protein Hanom_Chr00s014127g01752151 [Helianthus anomalus]|uniref:Uncharacterized protein n=1 Tax=Helianthus annuus TaxID=4232 RepID=A0A251U7A2_HELAN
MICRNWARRKKVQVLGNRKARKIEVKPQFNRFGDLERAPICNSPTSASATFCNKVMVKCILL